MHIHSAACCKIKEQSGCVIPPVTQGKVAKLPHRSTKGVMTPNAIKSIGDDSFQRGITTTKEWIAPKVLVAYFDPRFEL